MEHSENQSTLKTTNLWLHIQKKREEKLKTSFFQYKTIQINSKKQAQKASKCKSKPWAVLQQLRDVNE